MTAKFIKTAFYPKDYPLIRNASGNVLPEVAVVGRSNVGKSSLLNHLFHTKKLVKTSTVPGKTQALNFFSLDDQIAFADLPGYGYAQVPQEMKKQWGEIVKTYLEKRESLRLIFFLIDSRRVPSEQDLDFFAWAIYYEKPLILVLTKIDKLNQNEQIANRKLILQTLGIESDREEDFPCILYSVPKNKGYRELSLKMRQALGL